VRSEPKPVLRDYFFLLAKLHHFLVRSEPKPVLRDYFFLLAKLHH
jgi:hypothetical protein